MDNEIYNLVKHLSHKGLDNLSYEEKRVKLWQRAVRKWNNTHEPTTVTPDELLNAFKAKWPQIYGCDGGGNPLYLSFSYIDYLFTFNSKGQVCGGIWPKIEAKPHFPVNMTAQQIVELAALLRIVPEKLRDWKKDEEIISQTYREINDCEITSDEDIQRFLYPRLQIIGVSHYMLGQFEESFEAFSRSLLCLKAFGRTDSLAYAEVLTMLADNLVYLFHWREARWCFKMAYERLKFVEDKDIDASEPARYSYLDWAWRFAELYIKEYLPCEAIPILEKAEAVAKKMDDSEKLKSISDKLARLKAEHRQE